MLCMRDSNVTLGGRGGVGMGVEVGVNLKRQYEKNVRPRAKLAAPAAGIKKKKTVPVSPPKRLLTRAPHFQRSHTTCSRLTNG